jgi:hypothetical protein
MQWRFWWRSWGRTRLWWEYVFIAQHPHIYWWIDTIIYFASNVLRGSFQGKFLATRTKFSTVIDCYAICIQCSQSQMFCLHFCMCDVHATYKPNTVWRAVYTFIYWRKWPHLFAIQCGVQKCQDLCSPGPVVQNWISVNHAWVKI